VLSVRVGSLQCHLLPTVQTTTLLYGQKQPWSLSSLLAYTDKVVFLVVYAMGGYTYTIANQLDLSTRFCTLADSVE